MRYSKKILCVFFKLSKEVLVGLNTYSMFDKVKTVMENSNIYGKFDIFALIQSTNAFFVCH